MQTLAGQGYAILFCNSPGSQTYEQEYSVCLTGRWGELDFPVWMALVDKAIAEGIADPERLGVTGASYGGDSPLWAIGHPDPLQAAHLNPPVPRPPPFLRARAIRLEVRGLPCRR